MTKDFSLKLIRVKKEVIGLRFEAEKKDNESLTFCEELYFALSTKKVNIVFGKNNTVIVKHPTHILKFKKTKKVFKEIKEVVKKNYSVKALYCGLEIIKN